MSVSLIQRALAWANTDPDSVTKREVLELVEQRRLPELEERFDASLEFGTAGLRGVLGAGPNRMNRAVVRRTTAGFARYLLQALPEAAVRGVVVARDARHLSLEFATETASVLAAHGIVTHFFEAVAATPLAAFAATHLRAAGAIVVTASHNPPEYNGYKVYWHNGAQIIPPHDAGIAAEIEQVEAANAVPMLSRQEAVNKGLWKSVEESVWQAYLEAILSLRPTRAAPVVDIVYTAMHGVGGTPMSKIFEAAGFRRIHCVPTQQQPNADFPTVRFPNPEEPGALDLATALAEETKADIVLANDPDADRLAVMARDTAGTLRLLTGNEVGVLLGHFLLTHSQQKNALVATTIVSSSQLGDIAKSLGARCIETLTGFKWIANQVLQLTAQTPLEFVFGYEEALGYTVGTVVRDKDGLSAALVVADMAAWCKARGTTLIGYLTEIQSEHGLFVGKQFNVTLPGTDGAKKIHALMQALREKAFTQLGEFELQSTSDYQRRVHTESGRESPLTLPASNVVAYALQPSARVTVRPSGTEPKVKFYFELKEMRRGDESLDVARQRALMRLGALEAAFVSHAKTLGL
jgi:phosphomannomutase